MIDTLRKTSHLLGPTARKQWTVLVVLGLAASLFEAGGALVVYGLLTRITDEDGVFDLPLLGDLRDAGLSENAIVALGGAVVAAFFVLRAAVLLTQRYVENRVVENAGARLAGRLLSGYLAMPYSFHLERNSAELIRNAFDTTQQFVKDGLRPAVTLFGQTLVAAGLVLVLLVTNAVPTVAAVVLLAPLTWALLRFIHPRVKRLGRRSQELSKRNLQSLEESLVGWRDVRILGRERAVADAYERDRLELARVRYLSTTARALPRIVMETALVLVILAFLGARVVTGSGALDALPALGLFGYAAVRLQPALNEILVSLNALKFMAPGIDLLHRDLVEIDDAATTLEEDVVPLALERELRLEGVGVRYAGAKRDALGDVDLVIRRGEFVGIVGSTGGGKTTLVDVVLGLLPPASGRVTVDGVDLVGHERAWQATLGVVHQMLFLADATIRQNVALGLPGAEIEEERVLEAVRLAQLDEFVASLPDGLDTRVGQRGIRVSGGQRQRLAIARALYRRPSVLVLDEGTSALDHETETDVMDALVALRGSRTIIAVAHRLTTVAACDRVVMIEGGRLVDVGPFDELAQRHRHLALPAR